MFKIGDLITDGVSAGRIVERVERDPQWHKPGWRVQNLTPDGHGSQAGMTSFWPESHDLYIASPEWRTVPGGDERWTWVANWSRLRREFRAVRPCGCTTESSILMPCADHVRQH